MEIRKHLVVVAFLKLPRSKGFQVVLVSGPKRGAQALVAEVYKESVFAVDVAPRPGAATIRIHHPPLFLLHGWLDDSASVLDSQMP